MIGLPNPWLALGAVLAAGALAIASYSKGEESGKATVQLAFDNFKAGIQTQADQKLADVTQANTDLQAKLDLQRTQNAQTLADLTSRTNATLASLQHRIARPPAAPGANGAIASTGPDGGSTGAGLYRDDGLFLAGKADLWQRIRLQRDQCYAAYSDAQATVDSLNAKLAAVH